MTTCSLQIPELVTIPPGEFLMGESANDKFANDTERPAHWVRIAQSFALGAFPVTLGEYRALYPTHAPGEADDLPVVNVSWIDAQAYCSWLSAQTGRAFRLPSEAEWEYACRAGASTAFATGAEITTEDANFLYSEHGERIGPGKRTPAARYPANAFGLQDLHGNVCEWVHDTWRPNYHGAPTDGTASLGDLQHRVIRGGAWDYLPRLLRSTWRDFLPADARRDNVGFRIAHSIA